MAISHLSSIICDVVIELYMEASLGYYKCAGIIQKQ